MLKRQLNISKANSFFLFGARGTGKTSHLRGFFPGIRHLWIDLLTYNAESTLLENPDRLSEMITRELQQSSPSNEELWVVIDEVQKIPKLLDIVHLEIESRKVKFALTGSSARKLKRGAANMLAGRASTYTIHPFTYSELAAGFDLEEVLLWGSLPTLQTKVSATEKIQYLEDYVSTYLQEEVFAEQLARSMQPFRRFLRVAAQMNGKELNYSAIGQDLGIDTNTVRTYFEILEDTLIGFRLPATERSFRKQQLKAPKFYLFDLGVRRAIDGTIRNPTLSSQERGDAFEHFVIAELRRLIAYSGRRVELSFLRTKGGLEIDLVIEELGRPSTLVEIKSSNDVSERHIAEIVQLKSEYPDARCICVCTEAQARVKQGVEILPWRVFFDEFTN